jgi:hypothetical protein
MHSELLPPTFICDRCGEPTFICKRPGDKRAKQPAIDRVMLCAECEMHLLVSENREEFVIRD